MRRDEPTSTSRPARRFHFVPDECCLVLTISRPKDHGSPDLRDEQHERLYASLLEHLAKALPTHLHESSATGRDDPFARDLAPSRQTFARATRAPLLRPLARFQRADGWDSSLRPWVTLPGDGDTLTVLYFYAVDGIGAANEVPDGQAVRDVVNLLNRHFRRQPVPFERDDAIGAVQLAGASPNWLTGTAQLGYTGGSPGSTPESETTPRGDNFGRFSFKDDGIADLVGAQRKAAAGGEQSPVVVAVLDTCPPAKVVRGKADALDAVGRPNWLLREVADHVRIDDPVYYDANYERHFLANWGQKLPWAGEPADPDPASPHYEMPDHGLFAAGIVRDIAPATEIHLIRALDRRGVGDLLGLAQLLRLLPDALLDPENGPRRLVINLSLMVDLPPAEELLDLWFAHSARDLATLRARWTDICATLNIIHGALDAVIGWLGRRDDVLVVAAAGNDGQQFPHRPAPALPARYDSVLGVAALGAYDTPARYSNRGDFVVLGNGVAVYGGDVVAAPPGQLGRIAPRPDGRPDAVVGIFSADRLPLDGALNTTGWAYWAGTSFATPVITALAAALWTAEPSLSPRELIARVTTRGPLPEGRVGFAAADATDLDCAIILARQAV